MERGYKWFPVVVAVFFTAPVTGNNLAPEQVGGGALPRPAAVRSIPGLQILAGGPPRGDWHPRAPPGIRLGTA